jgi:DNA-binding NarL/FixJ family response regulator
MEAKTPGPIEGSDSRTFVLHVSDSAVILQDIETLERTCLPSANELPQALERLHAEPSADRVAFPELRRRLPELTRSEARVAQLAADGLSNKQIGSLLGVRLRTVESHLTAAYRKLGTRSRRELARVMNERKTEGM